MKFGVRECCDVVLRAKAAQKIGNKIFYKNEPVCYFDTLKTSTLEGAATTVYAQGGRGNARLMSWDGERTVTFTMEDALISPIGLAILTGAGLIEATVGDPIIQHITEDISKDKTTGTDDIANFKIDLSYVPHQPEDDLNIYVMGLDSHGEVVTEPYLFKAVEETEEATTDKEIVPVSEDDIKADTENVTGSEGVYTLNEGATNIYFTRSAGLVNDYTAVTPQSTFNFSTEYYKAVEIPASTTATSQIQFAAINEAASYKVDGLEITYSNTLNEIGVKKLLDCDKFLVDYYRAVPSGAFQVDITPDKFGGSFYLEASTLWRDQGTGLDLPAEFIIPNCRVQSNFTFTMASSGDPSSFTFTMDAFPDYTRYDADEKVLARIQVIGATDEGLVDIHRTETWSKDGENELFGGKQRKNIQKNENYPEVSYTGD